MEEIISDWKKNSTKNEKSNYAFIKSLKFRDSDIVDKKAVELHHEAFEKIDCLKCGNCCKTSKPVLNNEDIVRIAKYLNDTHQKIKEKYLEQDEEGDWITNSLPCPFLGHENICQIYSSRPTDCQEFPHTNKSEFASRSYQHTSNTIICPATYYIVERMKKIIRK